jgi:hypothetical protein
MIEKLFVVFVASVCGVGLAGIGVIFELFSKGEAVVAVIMLIVVAAFFQEEE